MARKRGFEEQVKSLAQTVIGDCVDSQEASQLAVEFLQASILHSVFTNDTRNIFLAKGGMAMRFMGSARRTMDIDLSVPPTAMMTTITKHMRAAIETSLQSGLLINPVLSEQDIYGGGVSPKWNINGFLPGGTQVHLTIEISRRDSIPEEGIKKVKYTPDSRYGIASYVAKTYSEDLMAASKVSAMLDNKRTKPRDLYDLYVLIVTMEVKPPVALLAATGKEEVKRMLGNLWDKLSLMDWEAFKTTVLPHLPEEKRAITESDYETMRIVVAHHVESWLEEAMEVAGDAVPREDMASSIKEIDARVESNRMRKMP